MPLIKQRPSINEDWLRARKISKDELIAMHPLADEDYLSDEHERILGKPEKKVKEEVKK